MILIQTIPFGVTIIICIDVIGNTVTHYKKNEMGRAYGTFEGEDRCSVLVGKPAWKETAVKA
jgi:hypothetical protein